MKTLQDKVLHVVIREEVGVQKIVDDWTDEKLLLLNGYIR
jgi:hypothetical protein